MTSHCQSQAQQQDPEQERLEQLLLEALQSPAAELTHEEWDDIRREALSRLAARKSA